MLSSAIRPFRPSPYHYGALRSIKQRFKSLGVRLRNQTAIGRSRIQGSLRKEGTNLALDGLHKRRNGRGDGEYVVRSDTCLFHNFICQLVINRLRIQRHLSGIINFPPHDPLRSEINIGGWINDDR